MVIGVKMGVRFGAKHSKEGFSEKCGFEIYLVHLSIQHMSH